jgi:hypothetical protein
MERSITETKSSRELEYRAYVAVKKAEMVSHGTGSVLQDVVVTYTNTGRTPAMNCTMFGTMEYSPIPIDDVPLPSPEDSVISRMVVAPMGEFTLVTGSLKAPQLDSAQKLGRTPAEGLAPRSPAQTRNFESHENQLSGYFYTRGVIEYDDIFGKHHSTRFCFFNPPGTSDWYGCAHGNTFDDSVARQ